MIQLTLAACLAASLLGVLISLPLTGCEEPPCCAYIMDFTAKPLVICPDGCFDDAGQTYLEGTVAYHKGGNPCFLSKGPNIEIINTETNTKLPPANWNISQASIYKANITIQNLNKDAQFELKAYGETGCNVETKKTQKVVILPKRDPHPYKMCTSHGDLMKTCKWSISYDQFGKGIVIDKVENPGSNKYTVVIEHKGINAKTPLPPGAVANFPYQGQSPNANWTLEIAAADCDDFLREPDDLCINLWVKCKCVN
jgi:hypothetical protein